MDAAGKDDVLLETVGVGQGEIDVVDHADTIVLALMPGSGDSIQALKAGVMEIPDVIVVNKADHPLAEHDGPRGEGRARARAPIARGGSGGADRGDEGRGRSPSCWRRSTRTGQHIAEEGTLAERRARNLRAEVLGIAGGADEARARAARRLGSRAWGAARPRRSAARSTRRRPPRELLEGCLRRRRSPTRLAKGSGRRRQARPPGTGVGDPRPAVGERERSANASPSATPACRATRVALATRSERRRRAVDLVADRGQIAPPSVALHACHRLSSG